MPDEMIVKIEDAPAPQPVAVPVPVQPVPQPAPAPVAFDEGRFERTVMAVLEKYPDQASRILKDKLGVTKLELSSALADACLEYGVDKPTAEKYRNLLQGETPEAIRAKVKELADLRGTQPPVAAAQPGSPAPVAQAPVPQYQAPPPLQTSFGADVNVEKLSYDDQCKLLMELAQKEW